ncbi:hypothetical protein EVAR_29428_1 [Eumeta japonica]|uniref:Uncharacterized protein n=1 Tax=Eumeta variegata TaxID=151549 RepID=A0A4C1VTN8_EUMVA|nr:hypothetical protein EVAR_29428_1 [Eumeta japonica]
MSVPCAGAEARRHGAITASTEPYVDKIGRGPAHAERGRLPIMHSQTVVSPRIYAKRKRPGVFRPFGLSSPRVEICNFYRRMRHVTRSRALRSRFSGFRRSHAANSHRLRFYNRRLR